MDGYHIALFLHIVTLVVAASATAVTKVAIGRRARARTVGEVLDWHMTLMSASKFFPICLVLFVVTGGYMLSITKLPMTAGFMLAGLVGVVLLLASGTFLGIKGKALKTVLDGMAARGLDQPAPKMVPSPFIAALPAITTAIALAVVFDMVTKPTSVPLALGIVGLGIVIGGALGMRAPKPAMEQARATLRLE